MKKQFLLLLLTGILVIMGWTIVEYLVQSQIQRQYQQLTKYPIIVFSWDSELMKTLQSDVMKFGFVKEVTFKTSEQSKVDLEKKYDLNDTESILQDNALPQMLSIYLKGSAKARPQKLLIKDMLDRLPDKSKVMIEYQNDVWDSTFKLIDQWTQIRWILIGFLSLVIFIVFLLKRLHYEHHLARIRHLTQTQPVGTEHHHEHFWPNTMLLSLVPVGISFILYDIVYTSDWLLYSMDWYFFMIQLGVILLAALVAYPFVIHYQHVPDVENKEQ